MHFITLSRMMGTKGTEIAKRVAQELGYNFYDTESIEEKAREMGFLDDIKEINDKAPPPFKRFFSFRSEASLDRLYAVIYELARQGSAVLLGRGGNMLFRSISYAFHVRVIASQETRLHNLVERSYTRKAALMLMERSDNERENFIKFAFKRDWNNPELYDIVLNMDRLTVDVAVDMILSAIRRRELQGHSGDVTSFFDMMELSVKVAASLAEAGFPSSYISAFVDEPGKVRLTGVVQVPLEKSAAEQAARNVKGVKSVENKIEVVGG